MKYQKIFSTDKTITFRVWADNGETEQQTYGLKNETEEQLMIRVANHFDNSIKARPIETIGTPITNYPIVVI